MPLILGTNSIKDTGYNVANSLRFNDGSSDYLTRAQSNGNQDKWTWSVWLKRSTLGSSQCFFASTDGSATSFDAKFDSSNRIRVYNYFGGGFDADLVTTRVFRDVSAWYHILVVYDSGNSTEAHRLRIYVNGTEESSFSTTDYPALNADSDLNVSGSNIEIGRQANGSQFFDGYMAEVVLIDGQALDPTSFGEFDSDSPTIWKPIDVSGLTFGNNGFYLDFENSGSLGADVSGNSNNFTVNNLTSIDQTTDTPTNNYATLNPLYKQDHAFSDGNLTYTSSASDWDSAPSTFGASSGKWYVEAKVTALGGGVTRTTLGICDERDANEVAESEFGLASYNNGDTVGYYGASANQVYKNGSVQSGTWSAFTTNDIIGMYVDLDNGYVYFSKNGSMQNSGDPTSGSSGTGGISITTGATYLFGLTGYGGGASQINFGSPPFSISSGNSDPNGYGNFEYSTQNYYALNTKNLAEYG